MASLDVVCEVDLICVWKHRRMRVERRTGGMRATRMRLGLRLSCDDAMAMVLLLVMM